MNTAQIIDLMVLPESYARQDFSSGDAEDIADWLFNNADLLEFTQWSDADRIIKVLHSCFNVTKIDVHILYDCIIPDTVLNSCVLINTIIPVVGGHIKCGITNTRIFLVYIAHGKYKKTMVFDSIQKTVDYIRMLIV